MVNLDCHSIYSTKRSIVTIDKLLQKAKEYSQIAVGLCDDSALYGAIEFYDKSIKNNIKPIIGVQFNFCDDVSVKDRNLYSLVLVAKNINGYKNLCKLLTEAYLENFYYVPRIDFKSLKKYSSDLLCLLTDLNNPVAKPFLENQHQYSDFHDNELNGIFGSIYYCIHPSTSEDNITWAKTVVERYPLHYFISNHVRFLEKNEYEYYDIMYCMNNELSFIDGNREHADEDHYFKSTNEIYKINFGLSKEQIDEGISVSEYIAKLVDIKFNKKIIYPTFSGQEKSEDILKQKLNLAWKNKIKSKIIDNELLLKYKERIKYEFEVITRLNYTDYFLIVADIVNYAKVNNMPVGPGRGSAAGSIISYLLEITKVDPIKYNLLFERFLDPTGQRISPPDIDIDFSDEYREDIVRYVVNKYGSNKVACVGNLSTLAFKSSIKDTGKVLEIPFKRVNLYTKEIPNFIKSEEEYKSYRRLKEKYNSNQEIRTLLHYANGVKGSMKNLSTHAAGIVIAPSEITDFTPLQLIKVAKSPDVKRITTQLDKDSIESIGLLKMDLLGLTALSTIDKSVKLIKKYKSIDIDIDNIDLDNKEIYYIVNNGDTVGLFQLESEGMTALAIRMRIATLADVCDLIALHRPAILDADLHELYIYNKFGEKKQSIHPLVDEITKTTYGVLIYQEQMMQATAKMALFTIAEADTLRRAIGKKSIKDIPLLRDKFINGCIKNNISQKDAENVFSIFENAGYAFNLSHSLSYSIIAAQTCFLKTYYPIEFLCASLTREAEKHERVKILIEESNKLNIGVLRPDINKSENEYIIEENKIRYGFNSIKGLGHSFTESILKNRKSKYTSFADFIRRISENEPLSNYKAKIQILIESGCFDSINHNRNELLSELMFYLGVARSRNKEQKTSLFDIMETKNLKVKETLTVFHKRNLEETHLGVYFS